MARRPERDELREEIRAHKLRATTSRIALLELLHLCSQPISHAEVAVKLSHLDCDPTTLYRNLIDFVDAGLVRRADVGEHVWRFALVRGEHDARAHPHFVCTECGSVQCMPAMQVPLVKAPRAVRRKEVEVHFRGLCDACA
jgi:Fur family transcriptional regulator, ferric uptake regulator